jgi:hypothetical protein
VGSDAHSTVSPSPPIFNVDNLVLVSNEHTFDAYGVGRMW